MPRILEEAIERLKQEVSLERLATARGVELTGHGADLMGLCPFHHDREPSLVISTKKNLWHCLGACQTGGTVIDWAMKAEGMSFRHAVELLQRDSPGSPPWWSDDKTEASTYNVNGRLTALNWQYTSYPGYQVLNLQYNYSTTRNT